MIITKCRQEKVDWKWMKMANGELIPGDIITIDGCDWKVLETTGPDGKILIWKFTGIEDHVFNENGSNVYEGSDIQKYLQNEFREDQPKEMLQMITDEGFFLLTEDQIRKYMPREIDRIATDAVGSTVWYWTASPYVGNGNYVRYVYPSGYVYYNYAYISTGVAPACWLQSLHL